MNSVLIVIDSKDMDDNSPSSSDFTLNFKNNFILDKCHSMFVKSVSVANVEYNIHDDYIGLSNEPANNNLYIATLGGLQPVINIPIGQYSLTQLITAIQNSTTGLAVGLTIVEDPITYKLTFNSTIAGGIII
jgi:hypothetical protein